jgi:two-component system LytT family response regulator
MKAIIIDDEKAAVRNLSLLIERHIDEITIVAATTNAREGIKAIESEKPDIVFLDISMPGMDGFALLHELKYNDFDLVFTTAHEQYAIQAFKHQATDYLVKPIDIDELKHAVQRLRMDSRIGLAVKEGLIYLAVADISRVESSGSYCVFHTADHNKYIVSKNIGEYESVLPGDIFFRIHKSDLINIKKVRKYIRSNGYFVEMDDGTMVEIARRKKDEFLQFMDNLKYAG